MLKKIDNQKITEMAVAELKKSGFPLIEDDYKNLVVADFGLSRPYTEGAAILTLFATERISTKLIVLQPGQFLPEHWHPPVGTDPGKEEILRGLYGEVIYCEEGPDTCPEELVLEDKKAEYSCRSLIRLTPGEQVIIPSGKKHWMSGGTKGGIVISFSTCVRDALDQFTDSKIERITKYEE